jgi:membrane-associated phospholipid phosphatase
MLDGFLFFDQLLSAQLQQLAMGPAHVAWFLITMLGHPLPWLVLAAWWYWSGRETESLFTVTVTLFSLALTGVLKAVVMRPRPNPLPFNVRVEPEWLLALSENVFNQYSFPSGHSVLVSSHVVFLRKQISNHLVQAGATLLVVLVGFSRIVLGQHFVSDVAAGLFIGAGLGFFSSKLLEGLQTHHFKLSKAEEMIGFLAALVIAVFALAWTEVPVLVLALLGYYAGFFLCRETGFRQSAAHGAKGLAKMLVGFGVLGAGCAIAILFFSGPTQLACFFLAGAWVTAIWPWAFETLSKPHASRSPKPV